MKIPQICKPCASVASFIDILLNTCMIQLTDWPLGKMVDHSQTFQLQMLKIVDQALIFIAR